MQEKTRVDAIYETIRDRICLGEYRPGHIFHEQELGQEFEVSRTPIRQVLQRLAFEKLTFVRSGVGTMVERHSDGRVDGYLEMHARILSTVSDLKLVSDSFDCEEAMANLQVRAWRLSATSEPERFWLLLKAVQELCGGLLDDDLLRHMDSMLFYRTGPAVMSGVRRMPDVATEILNHNVTDLIKSLDASDAAAFFAAQSRNVRNYKTLVEEAE